MCVCVCPFFLVAGLSAQVPPAKRLAAAEAAEERAEWPVMEARFQGMFKILICSSCPLRHPRWQRAFALQQLSVFVCFLLGGLSYLGGLSPCCSL